MSIENLIEELLTAVRELTAVIKAEAGNYTLPPSAPPPVEDEAPVAEPRKPKAEKPKAAKAAKEEPKAEEPEITYAAVSAAFVKYMQTKGRDAALAVLTKYDVDNLKLVDKRNWADVLADVAL